MRLSRINGFGGCNPIKDESGNVVPGNRTECRGDRTAWYQMPGYDLVPKGAGCDQMEACAGPGLNADECDRCHNRDNPQNPCSHAPSCDDHIVCYRVFIGCGCPTLGKDECTHWDAVNPTPGSKLTATGINCTDLDGFAFTCMGEPGAPYTLCSEPWPNAHTAAGRPILGGEKFCVSGLF